MPDPLYYEQMVLHVSEVKVNDLLHIEHFDRWAKVTGRSYETVGMYRFNFGDGLSLALSRALAPVVLRRVETPPPAPPSRPERKQMWIDGYLSALQPRPREERLRDEAETIFAERYPNG